eukprot:1138526-Pelagomonas_calceolata.AAC.7
MQNDTPGGCWNLGLQSTRGRYPLHMAREQGKTSMEGGTEGGKNKREHMIEVTPRAGKAYSAACV